MIPFESPLFAGIQSITIGDRARLQSSGSLLPLIVNWGNGTVEIGSDARTGSIQSVGPVLLKDRSQIDGSIETGSTLTLQSQTSVTGTVTEKLALSLPDQPTITSAWPTSQLDGFTVDAGTQTAKAIGAYASATVHSNGILTLNAGTYYFNSLLLDADATVVINGAVVIEVRDNLTVRGLFKDSAGHITQVAIRYRGTNTSVFEREYHGSILAPSAQLILGASSGTEYRGQFIAQQLIVRPDIIGRAEYLNDGGIFTPPLTQSIHYTGDARIIVHQLQTTAEYRLIVDGAATASTINIQAGETQSIKGNGQLPWTLRLEKKNAIGDWIPTSLEISNTTKSNDFIVDYVIPSDGSAVVVRVERFTATTSSITYSVSGTVTWSDGKPFNGTIRVYDKDLRDDQLLASCITDFSGTYAAHFIQTQFQTAEYLGPDVYVVAIDNPTSTSEPENWRISDIHYNAPTSIQINLVLPGRATLSLSEFEELDMRIQPLLNGLLPGKLVDPNDVTFLTNELSEPEYKIRSYVIAWQFNSSISTVPAMVFYGWLREGMPFNLPHLRNRSTNDLINALKKAQDEHIIDVNRYSSDFTVFATMVAQAIVGNATAIFKNQITQILSSENLSNDQLSKITALSASTGSDTVKFWDLLSKEPLFNGISIPQIQIKFALHQICGGNNSLIGSLMTFIGNNASDTTGLAKIDSATLKNMVYGSGIVQRQTNESEASYTSRVTSYTSGLIRTIEYAHPKEVLTQRLQDSSHDISMNFGSLLLEANPLLDPRKSIPSDVQLIKPTTLNATNFQIAKAQLEVLRKHLIAFPFPLEGVDAETKRAYLVQTVVNTGKTTGIFRSPICASLSTVLQAANGLNLGRTKIDEYLAKNANIFASIDPKYTAETTKAIRAFARLYAIIPRYDVVKQLFERGYRSAGDIARLSEDKFLEIFGRDGFGDVMTLSIHRTARKIVQASSSLFGMMQSVQGGQSIFGLGNKKISPELAPPSWSSLFERPSSVIVPEWQSVLSPAAYYVELLHYLEDATGVDGRTHPFEALIARRPDLVHIQLDRNGTFEEVSHSQLVLEILEAYVARQDSWTPAAWESVPWDSIHKIASDSLSQSLYPFEQPVDLDGFERDKLLAKIGLTTADLSISLCSATDTESSSIFTRSVLGLASLQFNILTETLNYSNLNSIDRMIAIWGLNTNEELTNLRASVVNVLDRAKITLIELEEYSQSWYSNREVKLQYGRDGVLEDIHFSPNLGMNTLHQMNIFFRLLKELRQLDPTRTVHQLDAALRVVSPTRKIDQNSLWQLARIVRLNDKENTGWFAALEFFGNIDTTTEWWLGNDGAMEALPSRFSKVFRQTGSNIDPDFSIDPTTGDVKNGITISEKMNAIAGALGIETSSLAKIVSALNNNTTNSNHFSVQNLSDIWRLNSFCQRLNVTVQDLILGAGLLGYKIDDIKKNPEEFLTNWDTFASLNIPYSALHYLYSNSITNDSTITPLSLQADNIREILAVGFEEIDSSFDNVQTSSTALSGNGNVTNTTSAAVSIDDHRFTKKLELIGNTLGDALSASPAIILDLISRRITSLKSPPNTPPTSLPTEQNGFIIVDIFACDTDIESFKSALNRLQKAYIFVDALGLRAEELTEIYAESIAWGGIDLSHFSDAFDGNETNTRAIKWFAPISRYATFRKAMIKQPVATPTLLRILKGGISDWDSICAITGWSRIEIDGIIEIKKPDSASLSNVDFLTAALPIVKILRKLGKSARTVSDWIHGFGSNVDIQETVKAKFNDSNWDSAYTKLMIELRNFRRERMVEFVLNHCRVPTSIKTPDHLYQWFLIDVKMDAGQSTSRIVQATATVQQFVQRCLLNLEQEQVINADALVNQAMYFPSVSPSSFDQKRWSWMKNYRVWEANRRVFLYPENYLDPTLRPDKSEFFKELEQDLMQAALTTETVEKSFQEYLHKLDVVARIKIVAQCTDPLIDSDNRVLHVFGRTEDLPGVHYHRTRSKEGIWTAWEKIPVEISSEHLAPVFYNRRLYLYWIDFTEKADSPDDSTLKASNGTAQGTKPKKHWEVSLSWTEFQYGKWSAKKMSTPENGSADSPTVGTSLRLTDTSVQPFEYRIVVDYPSSNKKSDIFGSYAGVGSQDWGRNPISLMRLRLMYSSDTYERKSRKTQGQANRNSNLPMQPSFLLLMGQWGVSRPGGGLQVINPEIFLRPTNTAWLNDAMSWRVEGPLSFLTPIGWDDPKYTGDYDKGTVEVLSKTADCNIIFSPDNQDLSFQPNWKPFFFMDSERSYLVTAKSWEERRTLNPDYSRAPASKMLKLLNKINPEMARRAFIYTINGASDFGVTGYSNQGYSYGYANGYDEMWNLLHFGNFQRVMQTARMKFEPHYHPYSSELLAHFAAEGVNGILNTQAQENNDGGATFLQSYQPTAIVTDVGTPKEEFDFSIDGAYSAYNWEIFFHIPILIATKYAQDKNYTESRRWFHFIFDPTTTEIGRYPDHLRFWKFRPLNEISETQRISDLLGVLNSESTEENASLREKVTAQINYSARNPFEPHGIARLRLGAYQKSVFMNYLDNIIEWADQLFSSDTREAINEATQLYVLASDLLGPAPERIPHKTGEVHDYAYLRDNMDEFGNALVAVEDWLSDVQFGTDGVYDSFGSEADAAAISGVGISTYFAIPDNEKLGDYWNRVDDRLYKIRHGLDINGNSRSLALFSPRIDPENLVASSATSGGDAVNLTSFDSPLPPYRFTSSIQKAMEFCNEVKSFGGALLSALEKKDAEALSIKRSQYELAVLQMTRAIRDEQINDAETALEAMQKSRSNIQFRRDYYRSITKVNSNENLQMLLLDVSAGVQAVASGLQLLSAPVTAIPEFTVGCSGFGGSPTVTVQTGGQKIGSGMERGATALTLIANLSSHLANRASILASRERREEEWTFQADTAQLEMDQLDLQIQGAQTRIKIAKTERASQELQIRNSQAVEDFLRTKFTNDQLYSWMATQLSGLYFKAYQMAYQLAKQAEACFKFEKRESPKATITFGYWDGLHKGLLAGEKLSLDLRRLEVEYLKANNRDPEITKNISLASLDPSALITLKTTGTCLFSLPETLFNLDHPGHFFRKIKSVSITIPSVTGPYSGINGMLILKNNYIRYKDDSSPSALAEGPKAMGPIVLSSGQNDTGMFETNLRDERYLPFEGCGVANSTWQLDIPSRSNSFDLDTISDVVLRIQYTSAISSNKEFLDNALSSAIAESSKNAYKLISLRYEFADAWHAWKNDPNSEAFNIGLTSERFPLTTRNKNISMEKMQIIIDDQSITNEVGQNESQWIGINASVNNSTTTSLDGEKFGSLPSAIITKRISITANTEIVLRLQPSNTGTLPGKSSIEDVFILIDYSTT